MSDTLALSIEPRYAPHIAGLLLLLDRIEGGRIALTMPTGERHILGQSGPVVRLEVADNSVFDAVLTRGDIGLAESFLDQGWQTDDLPFLLELLAHNRSTLKRLLYGQWFRLIGARWRHWRNDNSRRGSRRNILAHYDLGNDFYAAWLDPTMSYSAAWFADEDRRDLLAAQRAKNDRILQQLQVRPGDHVLEIGSGWGGFARHAVDAGLAVTGITLSPAQLAWSRRAVPEANFTLCDYRDIRGQFDHVVSVEMFEAVGRRRWPTYFAAIKRALKPGGRALVQTITMRDDLFQAYARGTDFIQQYIFPGGMLPSPTAFKAAARRQGLVVQDAFYFGVDYAETLAHWRRRFHDNWDCIANLGFDQRFRRLWTFYLAYCEAGFRSGSTNVVQFQLAPG